MKIKQKVTFFFQFTLINRVPFIVSYHAGMPYQMKDGSVALTVVLCHYKSTLDLS